MRVVKLVVPVLVSYLFTLALAFSIYSQVMLNNAVNAYKESLDPVVEASEVELPSLSELYQGKIVTGMEVIDCIRDKRASVTVITNQGVQVDITADTEIQPEFLEQLTGYNYSASVEGDSVIFICLED